MSNRRPAGLQNISGLPVSSGDNLVMSKLEDKSGKKGKGRSKSKGKPDTLGRLPEISPSSINVGVSTINPSQNPNSNNAKGKNVDQASKPKEKSKKKAKVLGNIDVYGQQFQAATRIEEYNFFQDLNYGDIVMIFNNPYYDFQLKERQEIETYQFNNLKELRNATMARINMSAKETKKMEANNVKMNQLIKDKFKNLTDTESKFNIRIDLQDAYEFYSKYVNLKPENQIESRKEEHFQKQAFANALIYFSDRYYVNDMARIRPNKQPYSDLSSQSLKDFLLDEIFEFNIFHKISKRKFYTNKHPNGRPIIGLAPEKNPLAHHTLHKKKPRQSLVERALSKSQKHEAFTQVFEEESNFFFLKKPDDITVDDHGKAGEAADPRSYKQIAADQYAVYIELTVKLNDASLHYYRDFMAKKEAAGQQDHSHKDDKSRQSQRKATRRGTSLQASATAGSHAFDCRIFSYRQKWCP